MIRGKTFAKNLLATLFWVAAWHILALWVDNFLLLPTPAQVFARLWTLMGEAAFWRVTAVSLGRVLLGMAAAVALGVVLAVLCCAWTPAQVLLEPVITAIQAAPVASFAILVLIWVERDLVPALICGMMVLPVVWRNVCAGIRAADPQLLEMARVFRLSWRRVLGRIYVPTVLPYFRAACGSALGLGWKAGIAAEVLTVPRLSMGRMISEAKLYLMTEDLFAWTLAVVVLSLLLQSVVLRLLKGRDGHA